MAINPELSPLTPAEAAEAVAVGVQSIRRWCEWHAVHLSAGASPGPGIPRRLTLRDVEVLKAVKDLRYQGLQTEAINARLTGMVFPEIDNQVDSTELAPPVGQDTPHATQLPMVLLDDLEKRLDAKIAAVQQAARPSWWWFALGLGAGLGLAVVAELFALVASRGH